MMMNSLSNCNIGWPYGQQPGMGTDTISRITPIVKFDGMDRKFQKIAELHEMNVLSDKEALEACRKVIKQHSKAKSSDETI